MILTASLLLLAIWSAPVFGAGQLTQLDASTAISYGVSRFNNVAVGTHSWTNRAFRWTQSGGMVDLGVLSGKTASEARSVSDNGSVIVGFSGNGSLYSSVAFRWTQASDMVSLSTLTDGTYSAAYGVSADGSVVVGESDTTSGYYRAFRWTQSGGMVDLGALRTGGFSQAFGVSADGIVVVGSAQDSGNNWRAFRCTQANGMASLGSLPVTAPETVSACSALAASADGSVIAGYCSVCSTSECNTSYNRAFRWTDADGMVDIGTLGGTTALAYGVSGDGSVIVGYSTEAGGNIRAFRWKMGEGMASVTDWLTAGGVDASGYTLASADAISADGNTVVGGTDTNRAYLAHVPPSCGVNPIKISGAGSTYPSIQSAYNSATNGQSILIPAVDLDQDLTFNSVSNIHVYLRGGYNCDYGSNYGVSTLLGKLTINRGSATVEYLIIK